MPTSHEPQASETPQVPPTVTVQGAASSSTTSPEPETVLEHISAFCGQHLNFYRVHVLAFTITPLVFAAIFYGSNGDNPVLFIDALFMCTSAMTVTGLNTVLLAPLTRWQQAILFILMCLGSTSGVSMVTIIIRRHFFRRRFARIVQTDPRARARLEAVEAREAAKRKEVLDHLRPHPGILGDTHSGHQPHAADESSTQLPSAQRTVSASDATPEQHSSIWEHRRRRKEREQARERIKKYGIRPDMVRRVDEPVRVNAMSVGGHLDREPAQMNRLASASTSAERAADEGSVEATKPPTNASTSSEEEADRDMIGWMAHPNSRASIAASPEPIGGAERPSPLLGEKEESESDKSPGGGPGLQRPSRRNSDSAVGPSAADGDIAFARFPRSVTLDPRFNNIHRRNGSIPQTGTVEFKEQRPRRSDDLQSNLRLRHTRSVGVNRSATRRQSLASVSGGPTFNRSRLGRESMHTGFGGFPNPILVAGELGAKLIHKAIPTTMTMPPRTATLQSVHSSRPTQGAGIDLEGGASKPVTYISFDAIVGRNSHFHRLTDAQQEELGGVEYRALGLLLKLVPAYWLGFQLIGVVLVAPWLAVTHNYSDVLASAGDQNPVWFSFFQVSSAYTNCGMSLVDASMTTFQNAYLMIVVLCVLILAGNTAFPIFLRLMIWTLRKVTPRRLQETRETLQFLLDHPRRCFIYLFPAYQTYFLLFTLVVLNCTDWVAFLVLDIGNSVLDTIPVGRRIIDGLLQSLAVRAAGFQIVSLSSLAPAVQVLYVIMMYIAVYPIALSIRTSNVYEERSLGIFEDEPSDDSSEEEEYARRGTKSYIAFHARKQLSFDLWWLLAAVWIICIVEKSQIDDPNNMSFFNIFSIIFEVTSAYGTVGLSLGLPYTSTSLSGQFRILSKLVVCAVMIRGRHRGLPIALDRAVLLPHDLEEQGDFRAPTRGSIEFHTSMTRTETLMKPVRSFRGWLRRNSGTRLPPEPPNPKQHEKVASHT